MISTRDPGLQPERTSLSWLRTQLVLFGIGVLLYKVSEQSQSIILLLNGVTLGCFTVFFAYYTKRRFTTLFHNKAIVGGEEATIKKLLSVTIFVTAIIYEISSLVRFYM